MRLHGYVIHTRDEPIVLTARKPEEALELLAAWCRDHWADIGRRIPTGLEPQEYVDRWFKKQPGWFASRFVSKLEL